MEFEKDIDEYLKKSAKKALKGNTPKTLRKASVELIDKEIQWLCVLDNSATEDDIEDCSIAGTEIIADFTWEYGINEVFEKIESNERPRSLKIAIYEKIEN